MPKNTKQSSSGSFESLSNVRSCSQSIIDEAQWLQGQTNSPEIHRYVGEALLDSRQAKLKLEKAFAMFEVDSEAQEENGQQPSQQYRQPSRRMQEQNS